MPGDPLLSIYILFFFSLPSPVHFIDGFLWCAEAFEFDESYLFIFAFVAFAFGVKSKKSSLRLMSSSLLPVFSSRSSMVLSITFKSLINFELIFIWYKIVV